MQPIVLAAHSTNGLAPSFPHPDFDDIGYKGGKPFGPPEAAGDTAVTGAFAGCVVRVFG
jgi:hypothetical protein